MIGTCHRCGGRIEVAERIGRRDACPQCGSDLHCCRHCRFYAPGHHNDCLETQAERQVDKEAGNFCEYFAPAEAQSAEKRNDSRAALDALFGGRRAVGAGARGGGDREHGGDEAPPSKRKGPRP